MEELVDFLIGATVSVVCALIVLWPEFKARARIHRRLSEISK